MTTVDHRQFELIGDLEREFAETMRTVIGQLLNSDVEVVEEYQQMISARPSYERLLALHESPLEVASRLTGVSVTDQIAEKYDQLFGDSSTDDYVETDFGHYVKESERLIERGLPYESLEFILFKLGYQPTSKFGDELVVWELTLPWMPADTMRRFVILPPTSHRVSKSLIGADTMVALLNHIFLGRLSSDDLTTLFNLLLRPPGEP
jgi:hypothetical protein